MTNYQITEQLITEIKLAEAEIEGTKDTEYATGWAEGATYAVELLEAVSVEYASACYKDGGFHALSRCREISMSGDAGPKMGHELCRQFETVQIDWNKT